ncbi:hypothetical protein VNO78_02600 [Psophocarpus tetragonolobus]|uniref:Uncharacterized protein n=1 Tax=Psophocarpus tetragonolobus TaxID=3891 RepID=A0AAN9XV97_PSOTE
MVPVPANYLLSKFEGEKNSADELLNFEVSGHVLKYYEFLTKAHLPSYLQCCSKFLRCFNGCLPQHKKGVLVDGEGAFLNGGMEVAMHLMSVTVIEGRERVE